MSLIVLQHQMDALTIEEQFTQGSLIKGDGIDGIYWSTFRIQTSQVDFFKAFPDTDLVRKGKQGKGTKKSKQHFAMAFFVSYWRKIDEPFVIWKSKVPRCFKGLKDTSRQGNVYYFAIPTS